MLIDRNSLYNLAYSANRNTSFDPEKFANRFVDSLQADVDKLVAAGVSDEDINRYISAVNQCWAADSRIASPMIVGPANFPVARQEKARAVVSGRYEKASALFKRLLRPKKPAAVYTQADEIARLRECAASACWASERRRYRLAADKLEAEQAEGSSEVVLPSGVKVVEDKEAMRLRIYTVGKPSPEVIALLKKHAFKWAPSVKAWQRQLTDNARNAFNWYLRDALSN